MWVNKSWDEVWKVKQRKQGYLMHRFVGDIQRDLVRLKFHRQISSPPWWCCLTMTCPWTWTGSPEATPRPPSPGRRSACPRPPGPSRQKVRRPRPSRNIIRWHLRWKMVTFCVFCMAPILCYVYLSQTPFVSWCTLIFTLRSDSPPWWALSATDPGPACPRSPCQPFQTLSWSDKS